MFTKYTNFKLTSRERDPEFKHISTYVLRGTVDKITKYPFQKEKTETIDIFNNGLFWQFLFNAKYVPDSVERLIKIFGIVNNKNMSSVGS